MRSTKPVNRMDATHNSSDTQENREKAIPDLGRELQLSLAGDDRRLRSRFLGSEAGNFWIVTNPYDDRPRPHPQRGDNIEVRYREGGAVCGFRTAVIRTIDDPATLLFLAAPLSIERNVLRATPRIECQLPCVVAVEELELQGKVLDISSAGCQCVLKLPAEYPRVPFKTGEEIVVNIRLPGVAYEQLVWGEVKNLKAEEQRIKFGLAFDELDVVAQGRLAEFLSSLADS